MATGSRGVTLSRGGIFRRMITLSRGVTLNRAVTLSKDGMLRSVAVSRVYLSGEVLFLLEQLL